nr:unnamed protein product [Callosobruchus analis]
MGFNRVLFLAGHQYENQPQTNQQKKQEETKDYTQATAEAKSQAAQIEHLIKTTFAQSSILQQEPLGSKISFSQQALASVPVTSQYAAPFSGDPSYPLNIPSTRNMASQQSKIDLSKYTNMGYTGPDINYTRSLQQFAQQTQTTINSVMSQKPSSVASTAISQASSVARYGNPLQQMTNQRVHSNFGANLDRLAQVQDVANDFKSDAVAKASYGGGATAMSVEQQLSLGAGRELAHIVDRLSGEERLMAGGGASSADQQQQQLASSAQQQQQQGFQSYAGLKGLPGASPEAIALKTSSVVPGSAFNFGPTTAGLAGLYATADKDAYPNFLEDSTGQPSASAAASYPAFLGATPAHHQSTRSAYPPTIGAPFISNAQVYLYKYNLLLFILYINDLIRYLDDDTSVLVALNISKKRDGKTVLSEPSNF